jgi:ribonuclease BN (tRNA processing enzyme)
MTTGVLLGSGGWIPTSTRATCSALWRRRDHALVIDGGTGVSRLVERPDLLDGVKRLDIVLTHFHLDHVVGLAYLPAVPLPRPPRIYGPGQRLEGCSTMEILERLIGPPFFAVELEALVSDAGEIDESGLKLGPFDIAARVQPHHNDPTLALQLNGLVTYCTDTSYDGGNVAFAEGTRVLMHEAWYTEDAPREESTHSSAREAAEIARQAAVERLVLIHIRPGGDEEALLDEARSVFENSVLGSDLLTIQ